MANERLRDSLHRAGLTPHDVAVEVGVDPKTVERWISQNRLPYPKHRYRVATFLGQAESYLWPRAVPGERRVEVSDSELVRIYPRRVEVGRETWLRLLADASEQIDVLVYSGLFLPEQLPDLADMLCEKVGQGAMVRMLLADPEGQNVGRRGDEEGIGDVVSGRVRNALSFYQPHLEHQCIEIRLHDTTLYNSIFRFDDEMIVNAHVFGLPAAHAPVLHLRRLADGDLFSIYEDSYDRVWKTARSVI